MTDGLTPMFQQYLEIRRSVPDALLFFRLGDFYELFFDDAHVAHRVLGLTLTSRDGGQERVPMCGVPYHAAEGYIKTLLDHGYKVAICEQAEDPKATKGLVRREVVRIITPGTVIEEGLLDDEHRFLAAAFGAEGAYGTAFVDVTTGECTVLAESLRTPLELVEELIAYRAKEVLVPADFPEGLKALIRSHTGAHVTPLRPTPDDPTVPDETRNARSAADGTADLTAPSPGDAAPSEAAAAMTGALNDAGLKEALQDVPPAAREAALALIRYIRRVYPPLFATLRPFRPYSRERHMVLDPYTRRNLELFRRQLSGEASGTLFSVVDLTETPMGRRRLARRLERPFADPEAIAERLAGVRLMVREGLLRTRVREALERMYDLERILARIALGTPSGGDLVRLRATLAEALRLKDLLGAVADPPLAVGALLAIDEAPFIAMHDELHRALADDPPPTPGDGRFFRRGYDAELDGLRAIVEDGTDWLRRYEAKERERTGIRSLKIGYNKVFGHYIEVTKVHLNRVPDDYVRRQTLAGVERYVTEALKAWEAAYTESAEALGARERVLYAALVERLNARKNAFHALADALAELDVTAALAELAVRRRYAEPKIAADGRLRLKGSRHPVVEAALPEGRFVKNDVVLDEHRQILLLTGPNMAGKSTLMRQVALSQILFQIGSFVPADEAELSPVDRIFTRMGAADDLIEGESTFMVEMKEVRLAVTEATPRSLLIIDELGRGTSTEDGMAIAQAVIEYIHDALRAKTLISTHYHELAALEERLPRLVNAHMGVEFKDDAIVFTHRLKPGSTSRSYGIDVAARAGLPERIVRRARALVRRYAQRELTEQPTLFAHAEEPAKDGVNATGQAILAELAALDLNRLTPLAAFDRLRAWRERLQQASDKRP
ncbi:MAG: DNA mismatch repair protein MutS [Hydrogenibacillus sp.]|nr:DNA mismatch repair protein MutS [Hydrogenibacillus sp.]